MRAFSLLQGLCSQLNVTVSFAEPMLRHALSLVAARTASATLHSRLTMLKESPLELIVLARLKALEAARRLVGAQVAVLRDDAGGTWECNIALGRAGLEAEQPVDERTLMPLLDLGNTALVVSLLSALSRPTSSGERVTLETPVWRLWPEFAQQGKKKVTLKQLLEQRAGLSRPFQKKRMGIKRFCNELRMEEMVAAAPQDGKEGPTFCPAQGLLLAALLRKTTGHSSASGALRATLEMQGLQDDIVFAAEESARMAHVVRQPIESLTLPRIFEWVETHQRAREAGVEEDPSAWLSWHEASDIFPSCMDPLLPNRPDLRSGEGLSAARGLRGSAQSLCRCLAARSLPADIVKQTTTTCRKLKVESLAEWEHLGRCLDVGVGWQLFRFRRLANGHRKQDGSAAVDVVEAHEKHSEKTQAQLEEKEQERTGRQQGQEAPDAPTLTNCQWDCEEVVAYGHSDASTGSYALRFPGITVVVLLNRVHSISEDPERIGFELLQLVAEQIGLEPVWNMDAPDLPAEPPRQTKKKLSPEDEQRALGEAIARMEERLEHLTKEMESLGEGAAGSPPPSAMDDFCGTWQSAQVEGLDHILELFQVPESFRFMARKATRTLRIETRGGEVTLATTTSLAGRTIDETTLRFTIGMPFSGEDKLGGSFTGKAYWMPPSMRANDSMQAGSSQRLVTERTFCVDGHDLLFEECHVLASDGRLQVVTTCRGLGEVTGIAKADGPQESITWFNRRSGAPGHAGRKGAAKDRPDLVDRTLDMPIKGKSNGAGWSCLSAKALSDLMGRFILPCMACARPCSTRRASFFGKRQLCAVSASPSEKILNEANASDAIVAAAVARD